MPKIGVHNGPTYAEGSEPEGWDSNSSSTSGESASPSESKKDETDPKPAPTTVSHSLKGQTVSHSAPTMATAQTTTKAHKK